MQSNHIQNNDWSICERHKVYFMAIDGFFFRSEMKIIGSRNAPTATNVLGARGMCQCATKRIMVLLCTHYNFSYARSDCWQVLHEY